MKKLMIAAAAGAMAFATVAADCGCNTCDTCSTDCTYAYEFILLAKSTEGKPASTTVKSSCSCSCTTCSYGIYRKPRMRKYAGFIFGRVGSGSTSCASACGCLPFYSSPCAGYTPAVGDGIEGEAFAPGYTAIAGSENFVYAGTAGDYQMFWDVRTKQMVAACLEFDFIDAIGYQSRETVEAVGNWAIEQTVDSSNAVVAVGGVRLAGFGTRGKRGNGKIMIKNISGFFAGTLPCFATTISGTCACEQTSVIAPAFGWTVCSDVWLGTDYETGTPKYTDYTCFLTAAYGKWTLKWNDTAAAHLRKSYAWTSLVKPGYATSGDVTGMQPEQDIAANLAAIKAAMDAEKTPAN